MESKNYAIKSDAGWEATSFTVDCSEATSSAHSLCGAVRLSSLRKVSTDILMQ